MNTIEDIRFTQNPLRVCRGSGGSIDKVCLNDLCLALKRVSFMLDGTALRKCPSATALDTAHPKELYVDFNEAIRLVRWIAAGSKILASTGRELLQLLQDSGNTMPVPSTGQEDMQEELIEMEYAGNTFSMKLADGRYMVNATEMARPFEKRPAVWLKFAETVKFRQALSADGVCSTMESQVIATRGPQGATWLEIHLWIQFAQWLSPAFASWCSKKLITMMRGPAAESSPPAVKPQHKGCIDIPLSSDAFLQVPASYEEALVVIDRQKETIYEQSEFLRQNRHKFEHYDQTIDSREWFSTTMIANELGVSAIRLNHFLFDQGIQERARDEWAVTLQFRHLRDTHIYEWYNHKTKYTNKYKLDSWTPCGREYIIELWKKNNS